MNTNNSSHKKSEVDLGKTFFKYRDYSPVLLIILMIIISKPNPLSSTLGLILILIGEFIRIYSVSFIGKISRTRSDSTGGALIKSGPFAYVRNPLYIGNFFITLGFTVFANKLWFIILSLILFAIQYYYITKYEEFNLEKKFGDEYIKYKRDVPAWIPKKKLVFDQIPEGGLKIALANEKWTFTAIMVVLLLLILL